MESFKPEPKEEKPSFDFEKAVFQGPTPLRLYGRDCSEYTLKASPSEMLPIGELALVEDFNEKLVLLLSIDVHKSQRGKGVGNFLVHKALDISKNQHKELVVDGNCSDSLFASIKRLENEGYQILPNPDARVEHDDARSIYRTTGGEWSFMIKEAEEPSSVSN